MPTLENQSRRDIDEIGRSINEKGDIVRQISGTTEAAGGGGVSGLVNKIMNIISIFGTGS